MQRVKNKVNTELHTLSDGHAGVTEIQMGKNSYSLGKKKIEFGFEGTNE